MKNRIKISLSFILLAGMLFTFQKCEKEENLDISSQRQIYPKFKIQTLDSRELISDKEFIKASKPFLKDIKISSLTKDFHNYLLLSLTQIKKITTNENTTYTFQIGNKVFENSTFENLIIKNVNNQLSFYFVQYITHDSTYENIVILSFPVKISGISIENELFNKGAASEFMVVDLIEEITEPTLNNNSGGGCAKIYYEACYLPNGGRGGADGHNPVCQHSGTPSPHGENGCNLMCSGSATIFDLTNCIENPDEEYNGNDNPFDQNTANGDFGGSSGGGSDETSNNNTLTSPTHSDGTSAVADFLINILDNLSQSQIDWINNPENVNQVDQLILFISQNGNSPEAMSFAMEALGAMINSITVDFNFFVNNRTELDNSTQSEIEDYEIGDFDLTVYDDFDPNQPWPIISPIISQNDFIGWGTQGIRRNCMDYAKAQIAKKGYQISSYSSSGQTFQIFTSQNGVNISQLNLGISYLHYALTNDIPVIVGVDDTPGSPNPKTDNTTDHFVVIVGMGNDQIGNYFQFYDNSSSDVNQGAYYLNRLYYDSSTGLIRGTSQTNYAQGLTYILSMIRKSKPL